MNIVVLAGGISTERDVSISSGTQVCKALRKKGHHAVLLDVFFGTNEEIDFETVFEEKESLLVSETKIDTVDPDLEKIKSSRKGQSDGFFGPNVIELCKRADIVYMGLHGAEGENGKIQATFDMLGIKYTGSGYLGSAIAMDKGFAKKVFTSANIPTPKGYSVKVSDDSKSSLVSYPCVVKPCCGGSSVGVSIANNDEEYIEALKVGFHYEDELLVEECIKGREFSVGVIDGKSLPIIEIIPKEGFYDYETKYQPGMASDECPARLSDEITKKMQEYAVAVFNELKLETYGRIDFLLDGDENMFCLEANTLPGMTPLSLLPQEALVVGVEYGDLCEQIIGKSLEKYEKKNSKIVNGKYSLADMVPVFTSNMSDMTIGKIVEVCGGKYYGPEKCLNDEISMITIDSRQVIKDSLFVAIKGERVDGNRFVDSSYDIGALCCMSEDKPENATNPYIVVDDCYQALKDMAEYYRQILGTKIIGITGSVGKTTTKEMIASVLSEHFHTLKTQGNFNNEVGVPLTLFRMRKEHDIAVVEMGISDFGEMTRLSKIVKPDSCIITNVGQCHLENLGDRDGVLRAKTEIFSYMNRDGNIYLNGEDDKLITVSDTDNKNVTYFGGSDDKNVYAKNIVSLGLKGTEFTVVTKKGNFSVRVPVPGKHMVLNALAAVAVGIDLDMTFDEIARGIEKFKPVGGHSSFIETDKFMIIDDCYNANPVSMKAGIDVLMYALGRKVAILGDMFELGENEKLMHADIGKYVVESGVDVIICVGNLSENIYNEAVKTKKNGEGIYYFSSKEDAISKLSSILTSEDTVLVKASHGMHFEKIVASLIDM